VESRSTGCRLVGHQIRLTTKSESVTVVPRRFEVQLVDLAKSTLTAAAMLPQAQFRMSKPCLNNNS
jgi:hypothetical protein